MSVSLKELLPEPSNSTDEWSSSVTRDSWFNSRQETITPTSHALVSKEPPTYGNRKGFHPKTPEDYGDGGAFPEILVAQFPLGMGQEASRNGSNASSKTIALQYDDEGKLRYDAIARVGHAKDKIVHTRLSDMKKNHVVDETDETYQKPSMDELEQITEATRMALEKITEKKVASALPVQHAKKTAEMQYIRYTPSQQSTATAGGAQQRIIRMAEEQKDPMEPPKFKINQKIPRAPPSPPAPVLHSPTRKVTAKEQADWKIPPCISNWKNPKGYTVALDKRLAADGRGLQQVHINENFAKMAEALSIAERKAREAVEARGQMERRIAQNKKAEQEKKMRDMAINARLQRTAGPKADRETDKTKVEEEKERTAIRRDRVDDHRRDRNIARSRPEKMDRLRREQERDISEKIVLGLPDARVRQGETQFDQRLFNQSAGLDSGGINEESYAVYDKPWRPQDSVQQHVYRPSKNIEGGIYGEDLDRIISTNRFVADRGFEGADSGGAARSGPVQFEQEEDIFGLGELLQTNAEPSASSSGGAKRRDGGGNDHGSSSKKSRR